MYADAFARTLETLSPERAHAGTERSPREPHRWIMSRTT
jgi:hypothetical protein